ncbi:MAG: hypothetical protein M3Q75_11470 [Gemmatimonadota bacterium]|nr:hypothetical protein [Gemmatimonadota bacterium]
MMSDVEPPLRGLLLVGDGPPEGAWRRALDRVLHEDVRVLHEDVALPTESAHAAEDGVDGDGPAWDDVLPSGPIHQEPGHPAVPDSFGREGAADDADAW